MFNVSCGVYPVHCKNMKHTQHVSTDFMVRFLRLTDNYVP